LFEGHLAISMEAVRASLAISSIVDLIDILPLIFKAIYKQLNPYKPKK
jgi:hypothetical protein